jgi:uncharacterized protein
MANETALVVTVLLARGPRQVQSCELKMAPGSTATMAVRQSGLLQDLPQDAINALALAIWGRQVPGSQLLRTGDRVELTRSLTVDPKVARRERFAKQGAKGAGLFAKRRDGAKAGY